MSTLEIANKRVKMTMDDVEASETNRTCAHWVLRKKRYCKITVPKGRKYCGEHEPAVPTPDQELERIPCPLDNKHTIYKNKLRKHLRICNARPREDAPAYIKKDINAGPALDNSTELTDYNQIKLHELADEEFYTIIDIVKKLFKKYVENTITELNCTHKSLKDELAKPDYGKETIKQLQQTSALLGVLEANQQLCADTNYIEFGAGKGHLAYHLSNVLKIEQYSNSQVVLLDRMSLRHKRDNKVEDRALVQRIRADIADFDMCELAELRKNKRNVALSKHLCGAATDLTLRCIVAAKEKSTATDFVMIAVCCHHRCDWRTYVGKEFLCREQLSPRQFVVITKMVSWAICGTGMSRARRKALEDAEKLKDTKDLNNSQCEEEKQRQRLERSEREEIGFMCKRILDYGRLEYLRQHRFEAELKYYVPRDVTLENVCLLARNLPSNVD